LILAGKGLQSNLHLLSNIKLMYRDVVLKQGEGLL